MKKIGNLTLAQLSKTELGKREMQSFLGGDGCGCACGCGGSSSTETNVAANFVYKYNISAGWGEGGNDACACPENNDACARSTQMQ